MTEPYWPDFNESWDYGDPEGTEAVFRSKIPESRRKAANSQEAKSYYLQLLTQVARALGLQKKFTEANEILDQVEGSMDVGSLVEVRWLLERGRVLNSSAQPEPAILLFSKAAALAGALAADFYTVDALHMLGIASAESERLRWNLEAIALAEGSADVHARGWMGSLYNNTGWTVFEEGRYEEALKLFQKAVSFREVEGDQEGLNVARWCVARTLRAQGRVSEALAIQFELDDLDDPDGFVEEEIGECLLALGRIEDARPYFRSAYRLLSQMEGTAGDAQRIERLRTMGEE